MCCWFNQVNAAAVTQQMLDLFDVAGIVHFGISGISTILCPLEMLASPNSLLILAFGIGWCEFINILTL